MYFSESITVRGVKYDRATVRENLKKLNAAVIVSVSDRLALMGNPPRSPVKYLISTLYQAIFEIRQNGLLC
jgi:hypothetical protein